MVGIRRLSLGSHSRCPAAAAPRRLVLANARQIADARPSSAAAHALTADCGRGGLRARLDLLGGRVDAVELSVLRFEELEPLVEHLPALDLGSFRFVSFHAPSRFPAEAERWVLERLQGVPRRSTRAVNAHGRAGERVVRWISFSEALLHRLLQSGSAGVAGRCKDCRTAGAAP